jgi:hypothetical protein
MVEGILGGSGGGPWREEEGDVGRGCEGADLYLSNFERSFPNMLTLRAKR